MLPVLFYHAGIGFTGGYVGVDVFFVISGYLITTLILREVEGGRFSMIEFWERRVRRILPALAVVVSACLAASWFLCLAIDFKELGELVMAQVGLVPNVFLWRSSGYFAEAAEKQPLLHTWSLAVEEQFYLVFPFVLVALNRWARKLMVPSLLLMSAVSFGLSVYGTHKYPSATFYLIPTRAWELLLGALLAAIPEIRAPGKWLRDLLAWVGLAAILCAVFFYTRATRFPGVAALLPCLGTALVIWANTPTLTSAGNLLSSRPLVFIGLISYSLYLWHWPMLVFANYWQVGQIHIGYRLLILSASVLLAALSWKWIEAPFRKRIILKRRVQLFAFAGLVAAGLFSAGLAVHNANGLPSRFPSSVETYAAAVTNGPVLKKTGLKDALTGNFEELGTGDKQQPIRLLLWGDSHAMAVIPVLDVLCKEHALRGVAATHPSTAPLVGFESQFDYALKGDSLPFANAILEFIRKKHVSDVLLAGIWITYYPPDDKTDRFPRSLLATISALKQANARVWILDQVPKHPWNVPRVLASTVFFGGDPEAIGIPLEEHRKSGGRLSKLFASLASEQVKILDPTKFFVIRTNLCGVAEGGQALYSDGHHLTTYGAMRLRPLFEPIFETSAKH